jgi:hypothetical protein
LSSAAFLGSTLGYLGGGFLSPDTHPRLAFVVAGAGIVVTLLVCAPGVLASRTSLSADSAAGKEPATGAGLDSSASAAEKELGATP